MTAKFISSYDLEGFETQQFGDKQWQTRTAGDNHREDED